MGTELNAVLIQSIEVSPGLAIMRIVPDGWALPAFTPGQFAVIGLPGATPRCAVCDEEEESRDPEKLIKRPYSIASSSIESEYLELYIVLVPSGALTPRLFALKPGDRLWLSPKVKGLFTLDDVPPDKDIILIGTGTGLAPYMSMLRTHLTFGGPRRFAVIHGARHSWDLGYRAELRTLERICPSFTYIPSITRPNEEPAEWAGRTGHLQEIWAGHPLAHAWNGNAISTQNTRIFLCGNPSMIQGMIDLLETQGFTEHSRKNPEGQIHVERYW